eukprot:546133-Prorocentrum_minimum.AAC.1
MRTRKRFACRFFRIRSLLGSAVPRPDYRNSDSSYTTGFPGAGGGTEGDQAADGGSGRSDGGQRRAQGGGAPGWRAGHRC